MRWKVLLVCSFAWLVLGIIGLHGGDMSGKSPTDWVVTGPASLEFSICKCVDGFFVDAAHGPPFLTIPGVFLVYVLPGVLLFWLALYRLRRVISRETGQKQVRSWPYAIVGALPLLIIGTMVFPWIYESPGPAKGAVAHGDYVVEPPRPCRPRTPANTHRVFYRGRLLTGVAGEIVFSPLNPSRILYEAVPWCTQEEDAAFYFDGSRDSPVKVFSQMQGAEISWSPDDRFVVLSNSHLAVINLQTGQSSDLTDFFVGKGVSDSHAEFRGWSPDGKKFALANSSSYRREDGSDFSVTDLVSLDSATLKDSYVATMPKRKGWASSGFSWVTSDGTYELTFDPRLKNGAAVYRRPEHIRTSTLGPEITLFETVRDFPGEREEVVIQQVVLHKGAVVWESRYTTHDISVSPDYRYLVAWNNVNRLERWRVYDLSTGRHVAIQETATEGARLPYKFGGWSQDSRSILVANDAYERATDANGRERPDGQLVPYRQTFLIDASSGAVHEQNHCQQPDISSKSPIDATPSWQNTQCAGDYRD